jgi:hypothetical protein
MSLASVAPLTIAGREMLSALTANAHRKAARRRNDTAAAGHHKQQTRPIGQLARPTHDQLARQRTQSTKTANGATRRRQCRAAATNRLKRTGAARHEAIAGTAHYERLETLVNHVTIWRLPTLGPLGVRTAANCCNVHAQESQGASNGDCVEASRTSRHATQSK